MFHLFENEEEKKARLQKNEDTKGFFKKAFGGFFDFEFSESKLKQALLEFDEKLLIQGLEAGKINPNRLVFNKMPIFMEAVKRDMFDFARQLVEKKADVTQPDSEGNTAVMVVVDTWWTAQNRKFWPLLKKAGADFDKPNNKGQTPLIIKQKIRKRLLSDFGGRWWIRTTEGVASRFTVCPLWPLGKSPIWSW